MLICIETRLLNGHGSEMEMLWINKDRSQEMELEMEDAKERWKNLS